MSIITVQVGQCGNQIGQCLFSELALEFSKPGGAYGSSSWLPFFRCNESMSMMKAIRSTPIARSILIDMEPKAVNCVMAQAQAKSWRYARNRVFLSQSGCGNNWAAGYKHYGPRVVEQCLDLVRKEAECTDHWGGILMMQSIAGGTGSGLGAFLAGALSEEFPCTPLLNYCIWPHAAGEVIVQNYNSLLTLSALSQVSKGVIVVENDVLYSTCNKLHGMKRVGIRDMNNVAANGLTHLLLPSKSQDIADGSLYNTRPLLDFVQHLCSHPSFPLLSLWSEPQMPNSSIEFTSFEWESILKRLHRIVNSDRFFCSEAASIYSPHSQTPRAKVRNVASLVVLRGADSKNVNVERFQRAIPYPIWNPNPLMVARSEEKIGNFEKSAAVLSNSQASIKPILSIKDQTWKMFRSKAYLHQYARYGLEATDFQVAFSYIEDLVASYLAL